MEIEDIQTKLLEDVKKYLEDDAKKDYKIIEGIGKKYFKSVQEIKAILARVGDEKSKQLLKQIIEMQVPDIEEITRKYIEDESSPYDLAAEYGIYHNRIRKFICEYAFATDQEKQYNMRRKHKESTMYKPREKKAEEQINIIINPSIIQNPSLIQEGEDR